MTEPCSTCNGEGIVLSRNTIANRISRELKETLFKHYPSVVKIWCHPEVYHLLMEDQEYLRETGNRSGSSIVLIPDPERRMEQYLLRPEGIPTVLAATSQTKEIRRQLLDRLESDFETKLSEMKKNGTLASVPEPAASASDQSLVTPGWGDQEMEREAQEAQSLEVLSPEEIQEGPEKAVPKDYDSKNGRSSRRKRTRGRRERSRDNKSTPETQTSRRSSKRKSKTREEKAKSEKAPSKRQPRRKRPARRNKETPARPEKAEKTNAPSTPIANRAKKGEFEPLVPQPGKALSFRPEKGSKLTFSSRRDLRAGGRKYDLWTKIGEQKEPAKVSSSSKSTESVSEKAETGQKSTTKSSSSSRKRPRRRTRSPRSKSRSQKKSWATTQ